MEIIIKGDAKEIAALVLAVQARQECEAPKDTDYTCVYGTVNAVANSRPLEDLRKSHGITF